MAILAKGKQILCGAIVLAAGAARAWGDLPITTLATFNGANGGNPYTGLTLSGNTLYGTTVYGGENSHGTIFSVPIAGGTPAMLASFNPTNGKYLEGVWPYTSLTLSGNTLYGMTQNGGANGYGTVFSIPATGGTPTVLASFNGTDGRVPNGGLALSADGNTLYGATSQGGSGGFHGTVFSIPTTGGPPSVLYTFQTLDGWNPNGVTLSRDGNTLYGTLKAGPTISGSGGKGMVFSMPVTGGTPTVLASFDGTHGNAPYGMVTVSEDGNTLYGTTRWGGTSDKGTVFSVPVTGGAAAVVASFNGINGSEPYAGLTLAGNKLYGTTTTGGAYGYGTVFSVPVSGGAPTIIASFNGTNGNRPTCDLTLSADGYTLLGTTYAGGASGNGTVFSITLGVPEPGSLVVFALGAAGLLVRRKGARVEA